MVINTVFIQQGIPVDVEAKIYPLFFPDED